MPSGCFSQLRKSPALMYASASVCVQIPTVFSHLGSLAAAAPIA